MRVLPFFCLGKETAREDDCQTVISAAVPRACAMLALRENQGSEPFSTSDRGRDLNHRLRLLTE
jgi:hypothetical protein